MSSRFSDKEKEIARDQIRYSGFISLGGTILAIGLGILVTLIAANDFKAGTLFSDITTLDGMQKMTGK